MIVTTTGTVEGYQIAEYLGIVTGEAIMGANIVRDLFASITDVIGGRSGAYEAKLADARETALREMEDKALAEIELKAQTAEELRQKAEREAAGGEG